MNYLPSTSSAIASDVRVGMFLARRELLRANKWTTGLITFVMMLTFLNLVVVSGILVGLIQGSIQANKRYDTGDVIISAFLNKAYIDQTSQVVATAKTVQGFKALTTRYTGSARVESNYRTTIKANELRDGAGASLLGINPVAEKEFSGIDKFLIEGSWLDATDTDSILIGKNLLYKYTPITAPGFQTLKDVTVGSRIKVTVGDISKEYYLKGVIASKVDTFDTSVVMVDTEARKLLGRTDMNANQVSILLESGGSAVLAKQQLVAAGIDTYGTVQTNEEALPKFLKDIQNTFAILGNAISGIGLVVAAITIFIVIFVNAITRRRFIGILKGIGITPRAIIISYIIQSMFYAIIGASIGAFLVFALLQPAIAAHPINFPFSDGILVATIGGTAIRAGTLLVATIIAGYIPARIVINQNTLDAILGR